MYHVIEIQSNLDGSVSQVVTPIQSFTDINKGKSAVCGAWMYAADPDLSKVDVHSAGLYNEKGELVESMYMCFTHEQKK